MARRVFWMLLIGMVAAGGACERSPKQGLEDGIEYAAHVLTCAQTRSADHLALESCFETGGTPVTYVLANLPPENPIFSQYEWLEPSRPWTVVIRPGTGEYELILEGFGEDLEHPLLAQTASFGPYRGEPID